MSAAADGKIVVSRVKHIAAGFAVVRPVLRVFVVGGKEIIGNCHSDRFTLAGAESRRFLKAYKLHGRFLRHPRLIGQLYVKLDEGF